MVLSEITRFFTNSARVPDIFFLRDKEKNEIDFLVGLPNQRFVAIEVKSSPADFSNAQLSLLKGLSLNLIERWVVLPHRDVNSQHSKTISIYDLWDNLHRLLNDS